MRAAHAYAAGPQEKTARKQSLESEVELCKVKLDRAHKLIAGWQA